MLVNLNYVLKYAADNQCAIGSFNTPTLENIRAVIDEAEARNVPVIIMHAQVHEALAPLKMIGPIMILAAKQAAVPVCVHLDHGESVEYIHEALQLGFTSVMYDGSTLPYVENVDNTRKVVALAGSYNASVEAEIGVLMGRESGDSRTDRINLQAQYTDPDFALKFVEETKIDALACSFGTAHGIYRELPKLDFPRIEKIASLTNKPLVMHGGSGVHPNDYRRAIKLGIRKINYYSYMAKAGIDRAKEVLASNNITYYHELAAEVYHAMRQNIALAMDVFYKN